MTAPVSHKLHVRPDGHMFVISGNPSIGYQCHHVTLDHVSDHKRSWQAIQAAGEWPGQCGATLSPFVCTRPTGHDGLHCDGDPGDDVYGEWSET